jgi:sorbitol-specific phosphotransferase system component IIA
MKYLRLIAVCIIAVVIAAQGLSAQDMPVPIPVQARFFKKVFGYDKSIPKDGIKIVIVFGDATPADVKDDIVDAFTSMGMKASAAKGAQLATAGVGANVIYLAPGGDLRAVKEFCKNNGVLSISGLPNQARNGDISIAMDAVNDAPKVVVNPDRLKIEKQDAAELMRLR